MTPQSKKYGLLPFRFKRRPDSVLLTNEVGEYLTLSAKDFDLLIRDQLNTNSETYMNLKSKSFIYDFNLTQVIEMQSIKYRTKNRFLFNLTSLHMFVVTLRCNHQCLYCHASSVNSSGGIHYDMDFETAMRGLHFAFNSPSKNIKIEFQGGEPLLNFPLVKYIVEQGYELNNVYGKNLEFVICTNLLDLKWEHLDFFKKYSVVISTSLDGPREIHDRCRLLRNGSGSYDRVVPNIKLALEELGHEMVSGLMTITQYNLNHLKVVIDEYLNLGLGYIFLRELNPFGAADQNRDLTYSTTDFLKSYKSALDYILKINLNGSYFPEVYATILLERILTPFSTGFMDLQSPMGAGLNGIIFDVNGDVFISDEARMLYRTTGDKYFCIGNLLTNSYENVFCNNRFKDMVRSSCIELTPGCSWCSYKPYCGSDIVKNYFKTGSIVLGAASNSFCEKHRSLFELLFNYIEFNNDDIQDIFWSWITRNPLSRTRQFEPVSKDSEHDHYSRNLP